MQQTDALDLFLNPTNDAPRFSLQSPIDRLGGDSLPPKGKPREIAFTILYALDLTL